MSNDAGRAISEEIGDHWNQMIQDPYVPAMKQKDEIHQLASAEDSEMSARDIGMYNAGVLRGLEIARAAVGDVDEEDE